MRGLAPIKWRGICSALRSSFELRRADVVERRMAPDGVVEAVDVAGNGLRGFVAGVEDCSPDELGSDGLEDVSIMALFRQFLLPDMGIRMP